MTNPAKTIFEKASLLSKASDCLESALQIYHEHFTQEIATDDRHKHISKELKELVELLEKERKEFTARVESLEEFKSGAKELSVPEEDK